MKSIPCRICQKAVHGDHDGKGYKVGSYKFAVCLEHVQAVERSRAFALQGAKALAREVVRKKFPLLNRAIETVSELKLGEDFFHE